MLPLDRTDVSPNRSPLTLQQNLSDRPPVPTVDEIENITSFQTLQPDENQADMKKTGLEKYELLQYIGSVSIFYAIQSLMLKIRYFHK